MSEGFARADLTADGFLGGRLTLLQPRKGYRAGLDPVFLAAACPAEAGQSVLDLGCGAGAAALSLGARVAGLTLAGVEKQPEYAALARQNAAANGIGFAVHAADLAALPAALAGAAFDHVIMNPPYHLGARSAAPPDPGRAAALVEAETPLVAWIDAATRRLRPRGYLTLIQKAERLPEILAGIDARLGSIVARPLAPRPGRPATLVIVQARKGGRGGFRLAPPLLLHLAGADGGSSYSPEAAAILRDAAPLPM